MSILTVLLSATFALSPAAEDTTPPAATTSQDADEAARVGGEGDVSVYEFADDTLTGEHLAADGSMIPWRRPPHHESLIDLRGHFMPELVRLALDL